MSVYKPRIIKYSNGGRNNVFPFRHSDFNEMCRLLLIKRDTARTAVSYRRHWRNYILLLLGVNTGCRIEVELQLQPRDIAGGRVCYIEFKTGKKMIYDLNEDVYKAIQDYIEYYQLSDNQFIFEKSTSEKPITRDNCYKMLKKLSKEIGITYSVGCHSLRKSFGRFLYDDTHDLVLVQKALGHCNPLITLRYICLEDDKVTEKRKTVRYGL